jgi:hypothetical protein
MILRKTKYLVCALMLLLSQQVFGQSADDKYWFTQFGNDLTTDGQIYSVAINGNTIYVGGSFTKIGGVAANHIAMWSGKQWLPLGQGVDGDVWAINVTPGVLSDKIYVGGSFRSAGGKPSESIALWDGTSWSSLGVGLPHNNFGVHAIAVDAKHRVYAAGGFTGSPSVYGDTLANIALWDGAKWTGLQGGVANWRGALPVWSLAIDGVDSMLYVGGYFSSVGGGAVPAHGVAAWTGKMWLPLSNDTGADVHVTALTLIANPKRHLIAAGEFSMIGSATLPGIGEWDGAKWTPLGAGTGFPIGALATAGTLVYAGHLEIGGTGDKFKNIAFWDGANWNALGSGVNAGVNALVADPTGKVCAVGYFDTAGMKVAMNVAEWTKGLSSVGQGLAEPRALHLSASPNPTHSLSTIEFDLPNASIVRVEIRNIIGNVVSVPMNIKKDRGHCALTWNSEGLPSGTYFCEVRTAESFERTKIELQK